MGTCTFRVDFSPCCPLAQGICLSFREESLDGKCQGAGELSTVATPPMTVSRSSDEVVLPLPFSSKRTTRFGQSIFPPTESAFTTWPSYSCFFFLSPLHFLLFFLCLSSCDPLEGNTQSPGVKDLAPRAVL